MTATQVPAKPPQAHTFQIPSELPSEPSDGFLQQLRDGAKGHGIEAADCRYVLYLYAIRAAEGSAFRAEWWDLLMGAAGNGSPAAQDLLAVMYMDGLEVEADPAKARYWAEKGRMHNLPRSLLILATLDETESGHTFEARVWAAIYRFTALSICQDRPELAYFVPSIEEATARAKEMAGPEAWAEAMRRLTTEPEAPDPKTLN